MMLILAYDYFFKDSQKTKNHDSYIKKSVMSKHQINSAYYSKIMLTYRFTSILSEKVKFSDR